MNGYKTFGEYLEQRDGANDAAPLTRRPDARGLNPVAGSPLRHDPPRPDTAGGEGQVETRSIFGNLFKSPFKAVNPARPVSPTNSRLLASPFRRKRLKSQIIGRDGDRL
jgi:hypothetical protein